MILGGRRQHFHNSHLSEMSFALKFHYLLLVISLKWLQDNASLVSTVLLFQLFITFYYSEISKIHAVDASFIDIAQNLKHVLSCLMYATNKKPVSMSHTGRDGWIYSDRILDMLLGWSYSALIWASGLFCPAEVIKSTFESWELLLMPLSLMLSQENDIPEFFFPSPLDLCT